MPSRSSSFPELILFNGHFQTQDPIRPYATAVAVRDGVLMAVGDNDSFRTMAGRQTRTIDLHGGLVLPGFIDAHLHFRQWALGRKAPDLSTCRDLGHLQDAVETDRESIAHRLLARGAGIQRADSGRKKQLPTRDDLDAAVADRPVIIWREDMHLAVANSCALARAGITHDTPDPPQGSHRPGW